MSKVACHWKVYQTLEVAFSFSMFSVVAPTNPMLALCHLSQSEERTDTVRKQFSQSEERTDTVRKQFSQSEERTDTVRKQFSQSEERSDTVRKQFS